MSHDVFISYSSKNHEVAELIFDKLTAASVKCWMAPMSLNGGDEYEDIIDKAISESRIVVLVYSEPAVKSRWVNSEVTIAFNEYKHIIPFKIDTTVLEGKMKIKLIQSHFINAYPEFAAKINELVQSVKATLDCTIDVQNDESAKELNFVQRFEFEDAVELFKDKKTSEALDKILPLALKGNRESQELLCKIYFHITTRSTPGDTIRSIRPGVKDTIEAFASTGADWANFIMHCYAYKQNDNNATFRYLKTAVESGCIGYAFLRLGIVYGYGIGVDVNWNHALDCYREAEKLGCTEVYSYMAQYYCGSSILVQPDMNKAIEYYMNGVDANDWRAIKGLNDLYLSDSRYVDKASSLLDKLAEKETKGIELLYGDYYRKKYYMKHGDYRNDLKQAIEFLQIALNNGYIEAYGTLASIYYCEKDMIKAAEYAEMGYKHGDSLSYHYLYLIEEEAGNYARAWEVTEERNNNFCIGGGYLGQIFITHEYLPSKDYLPRLLKLLQRNAAIGGIISSRCLITLYSEERFQIKNTEMEEKYRRVTADIAKTMSGTEGVKDILDYVRFLMDKESTHYNPMIAVKYINMAIEKKSVEAAGMLLSLYDTRHGLSYHMRQYDKARSYIIRFGAYDIGGKVCRKLIGTPVTPDNASYVKEFYLTIVYGTKNRKYRKIHAEACTYLIAGMEDGHWQLTDEERLAASSAL